MVDKPVLPPEVLRDFCTRWKVRELAVFGSYLRQDFGSASDLDFLVTFDKGASWSLLDHVRMEDELAALLGRSVDLVSRRAVEASGNAVRRAEILTSARVLYAA